MTLPAIGLNASTDDYTHCDLFIIASLFNHSCFPNARRSSIGDMSFIHATSDMKAGTEVFVQYKHVSSEGTYQEIKGKFGNWNFVCTCGVCEDRKQTGTIFHERLALAQELRLILANTVPDIPKALRVASAIEDTYRDPPSEVPRFSVAKFYHTIIRIHHTL